MDEVSDDIVVDSQNVIMALALQRNSAMDQLAFWQAKAQQLEAALAERGNAEGHQHEQTEPQTGGS